ncbi:hypothetical protein D8B26_003108 [Coccidioides posadasii str. Silveira]|uniref:Ribonuclease H2 subunit B n=2 Tax=Coccidioides posadasii TaxID=199306 RepID=E9CZ85_COCPS|nr:hypothetical protein CPC735_006800 [Coccidioides posadasii C735 delta SOWgp]EER26508.1 hypothetical protein CPC735_006800 [Coccidioides posadasii C735 delta SOWgp]EFW20529.1 conserved hypothetical protein [Coccidioides posadasii str. Silveira]QVM08417.1 hypothetical protein D8B26_003108 [Coccidioides posadasii str. Silveira]|eukprot:XP_003068653.1 hypothetical protein CPC735_006800 [Coccidioides posadasii C735 delta SOWgp]
MRTRSSAPAPTQIISVSAAHSTTAQPQKQPKTLVLPTGACEDARFVLLEDPRTGAKSRYYFCPKLGLFEFTLIAPPASTPRSILFVQHPPGAETETNGSSEGIKPSRQPQNELQSAEKCSATQENGFTSRVAELLVATPIDVMFFLLPILAPSPNSKSSRRFFQPLDDVLDAREDLSKHLRNILLDKRFRPQVEHRMSAICDMVEAGEPMFRISEDKLVTELLSKAERIARSGLPPSMEERFVRRALELPILSISKERTSVTTAAEEVTESKENSSQNGMESQVSVNTTASSTTATTDVVSSASISSTSTPPTELSQTPLQNDNASPSTDLIQLLRIRTALQYIQSSYLPPHLSAKVDEILASPSSPKDFTTLTEHLKYIAKVRAEEAASRSLYDNVSRKRGLNDEEAEAAAEKRRKQDEEEKKKKAKESRGVRELKKVNTSGMKKLSAFFGKKS